MIDHDPSRRVVATQYAASVISWLGRSSGGLVLVHLSRGESCGEAIWIPSSQFRERDDISRWDDVSGSRFYVQTSDAPRLETCRITLELGFERNDEFEAFGGFRLVSVIQPLLDDEIDLRSFAREYNAARLTQSVLEKLSSSTGTKRR